MCVVISVVCVKVEGVGTDGRMFVLQRPTEAEQINQLWLSTLERKRRRKT